MPRSGIGGLASEAGLDVEVIQDSRHAFAATRGVMRLMWFSVAVAVTLLTFLAVFFSLHRRPDYTDIQVEEEPAEPAASK